MTRTDTNTIVAVAAMSHHHGSFEYLCECGGSPFLSHTPCGHVLYHYDDTEP